MGSRRPYIILGSSGGSPTGLLITRHIARVSSILRLINIATGHHGLLVGLPAAGVILLIVWALLVWTLLVWTLLVRALLVWARLVWTLLLVGRLLVRNLLLLLRILLFVVVLGGVADDEASEEGHCDV